MNKILILQTAFIGDVVLATSLVEETKKTYPDSEIHFMLRDGNQNLLKESPYIQKIIIWNKKKNKNLNLLKLAFSARKEKYDLVLNIQRFASSGIFMLLCGAKRKVGFKKNPFSVFFNIKVKHEIPFIKSQKIQHEVQRNSLLLHEGDESKTERPIRPSLFFNNTERQKVLDLTSDLKKPYIVLAPSSVWFTKQWHQKKWSQLSLALLEQYNLFFIGGPDDSAYIEKIKPAHQNAVNLCGKLSLTESALLMKDARRVIVNDSAPLHLASSVNANTTAIFCSTIKDFGYFPLSENSKVIEVQDKLECRPCGLHGKKSCPLGHFKCSENIDVKRVIETI
jgi:lipopolysaccharide heptosyltransferase II